MVNPNSTENKTLHPTLGILQALQDLIDRKYNKDGVYRDDDMPPVKVVLGEPSVLADFPSIAISPVNMRVLDASGRGAGAEVDPFNVDIICYTKQYTTGSQVEAAVKMADTIRQIIADNVTLSNADGNNEKVFHAGYREINISFGQLVVVDEGFRFGVDLCKLSYPLVYGELGY